MLRARIDFGSINGIPDGLFFKWPCFRGAGIIVKIEIKKLNADAIILFCVLKKLKKNYSVCPTIASWYIQSMSG